MELAFVGARGHITGSKRSLWLTLLRCTALVMLACFSDARPLRAQVSIPEELKQRVEQLRSGRLVLASITITGSSLLANVYQQAGFAPLWNAGAASNLVRALREAAADGLRPSDYNLAVIEQLSAAPLTPAGAAELELLRTDALIRIAYDLRFGKANPERLAIRSALAGSLHGGDPVAEIRRMISSARLYDDVLALRPDHFVYRGLMNALARLRRVEQAGGWATIPAGPTLRRDSADARVPLLRQRLVVEGDLANTVESLRFDTTLERALQSFQHRHALNPDGVFGPATLAELNVPVETRINQVRVNLERARWVTHDLPDTFVGVNVAGAMIYLIRDGSVVFETRAVVGTTYRATPVFRATLRYIELNPTWTVPPGIVGEVLTAIRRNPDYLRAEDIRVLSQSGNLLDASRIDFSRYSAQTFPYVFRQEPGPRNPLGRIKFVFPNSYNVYLHDTPAHELFERAQRTFSHGCIRVHEPLKLATLILNDSARWSSAPIQAAIETGSTRTITLATPIPVLVLYWTASADLHGELHFYRDVYRRDPALLRALDR